MSAPAFDNITATRALSFIPVVDAVYALVGWLFYDPGDRNERGRGLRLWRRILIIFCLLLDFSVFVMVCGT